MIVALTAMVLAGCSQKRSNDAARRKAATIKDPTVYARIESTGNDSISVALLADSSLITVGVANAAEHKAIAGELTRGDTLAMVLDDGGRSMVAGVNVSQLVGLWLCDDGSGNGLRLAPDGAASSVGTGKLTLRTWRISNGRLVLTYIMPDGTDYTEKPARTRIVLLASDSLRIEVNDTVMGYTRSSGLLTI